MRIALIGNPNCGKTTLFNALTGEHQHVGNWPGVTVEKKTGCFLIQNKLIELVDLPGIYSLNSSKEASQDEQISALAIVEDSFDCLINVIDVCHFERHLYLTTQLLELGIPVIVVLNMMDLAHQQGIQIQSEKLAYLLQCPVISLQAHKGIGIDELKAQLNVPLRPSQSLNLNLSTEIKTQLQQLELTIAADFPPPITPYVARRIVEGDTLLTSTVLEDKTLDLWMADARYYAVNQLAREVVFKSSQAINQKTARIDKLVLHRYFAFPIFFSMMYALFFFAIHIGGAFQDFFAITSEALFVQLPTVVMQHLHSPSWLIACIANGIGLGISTTLSFIPVLAAMYFFLSFLEASGYMTRAAFIMDKAMRYLGLPGKSFVPLIVGFGCNVPAIMAARTLDSEQDRLLTIVMSPFMSCSARLAIYAVFVAAFFPVHGQNILFSLYMIGILMAVGTGFLLRKTLFKGSHSPLIIELPVYHRPQLKRLCKDTYFRLKMFIKRASVVIIPVCAVVGTLNTFSIHGSLVTSEDSSILAWIGHHLVVLFSPMGLSQDNWPAAVGLMTGVLAKEVVIGTLNSLYVPVVQNISLMPDFNLWHSLQEAISSIPAYFSTLGMRVMHPMYHATIHGDFSPSMYGVMQQRFDGAIGAYAYLLFILLYIPCVSTMAVIRQEANQRLMWFSVIWSTLIAYVVATIFYQISTWVYHPKATFFWIISLSFITIGMIRSLLKNTSKRGLYASAAS